MNKATFTLYSAKNFDMTKYGEGGTPPHILNISSREPKVSASRPFPLLLVKEVSGTQLVRCCEGPTDGQRALTIKSNPVLARNQSKNK